MNLNWFFFVYGDVNWDEINNCDEFRFGFYLRLLCKFMEKYLMGYGGFFFGVLDLNGPFAFMVHNQIKYKKKNEYKKGNTNMLTYR